MTTSEPFRIGTGAGFSADRLDPAVDLAERGGLDCLVFECIGERTLAFGHRDRIADPEAGFNPWLARRLRAVLPPCARRRTRIVTNMGVANPAGAAHAAARVARELGLDGLSVAWLEGDDVADQLGPTTPLPEIGSTIGEVGRPMVGANAYLGADAILPALELGADVVITGRVADPSLFLAPLRHAFGWAEDDWERLGRGTMVGHLLECAAQITGGYFADPPYKVVPGLARVGFPFAEVAADGTAVVTKLEGTGGCVTEQTVKEQILYEVHDPAAYVTPDVIADFSGATLEDDGPDRVRFGGGRGAPRPDLLKVTVAFDGGLVAEAGVSYAGPGAVDRAKLAAEVVEERMRGLHGLNGPLRIDLIGVQALHGTALDYPSEARDVRLRAALRAGSRDEAELLLWEVEALLCCGPAGGGGYRGRITPSVITHNAFLPRERVRSRVEVIRA
ncbi:MAG TPA: acyclic terpene utilization AtuA family protein [Geminicoccaceae bacterium]